MKIHRINEIMNNSYINSQTEVKIKETKIQLSMRQYMKAGYAQRMKETAPGLRFQSTPKICKPSGNTKENSIVTDII